MQGSDNNGVNGQHQHQQADLNSGLQDLTLDDNHIHATVRNGYEEDFEGYGEEGADGMGAEVNVEHACRCVEEAEFILGFRLMADLQLLWDS